jgi:hypothetical protein
LGCLSAPLGPCSALRFMGRKPTMFAMSSGVCQQPAGAGADLLAGPFLAGAALVGLNLRNP